MDPVRHVNQTEAFKGPLKFTGWNCWNDGNTFFFQGACIYRFQPLAFGAKAVITHHKSDQKQFRGVTMSTATVGLFIYLCHDHEVQVNSGILVTFSSIRTTLDALAV